MVEITEMAKTQHTQMFNGYNRHMKSNKKPAASFNRSTMCCCAATLAKDASIYQKKKITCETHLNRKCVSLEVKGKMVLEMYQPP